MQLIFGLSAVVLIMFIRYVVAELANEVDSTNVFKRELFRVGKLNVKHKVWNRLFVYLDNKMEWYLKY